MTDLSPSAQAVYDAAMNTPEEMPYEHDIAAALRAAADQVVPEEPWHSQLPIDHRGWYSRQRYMTRERLLAIAAELEADR